MLLMLPPLCFINVSLFGENLVAYFVIILLQGSIVQHWFVLAIYHHSPAVIGSIQHQLVPLAFPWLYAGKTIYDSLHIFVIILTNSLQSSFPSPSRSASLMKVANSSWLNFCPIVAVTSHSKQNHKVSPRLIFCHKAFLIVPPPYMLHARSRSLHTTPPIYV